jgi:hypothetical protein
MKPSDETIERFRKAFLEEFGEEITANEASDEFINLVELLKVVLGPRFLHRFENPGKTGNLTKTREVVH